MKELLFGLGLLLSSFGLVACTSASTAKPASATAVASIVPKPSSYVLTEGTFTLTADSKIVLLTQMPTDLTTELRSNVAEYLATILRRSTGFDMEITHELRKPESDIILILGTVDGGDEAYTINVASEQITLTANTPAGLFRGVQTLRQLFGAEIESATPLSDKAWSVACAEIKDSPAYEYRGLMLDVARHFFTKDIIMRQIDLAASYKINKIHLHLTDDQGWRIEIKSRPALTEVGSVGAVTVLPWGLKIGGEGGYYTQEDFKEIVAYAAARYMEVIPEIDMPSHTNAALSAIPELNPNGKLAKPRYDIEVGYSTLQARSEATYVFIDDVIKEVAAISPSPYFHIGGDEADSTSKEDYNYFFERVSAIAKKYGKTTIGWNPYEGSAGVVGDSILQNWDGTLGSSDLADSKGLRVILSPANAYIDQRYNDDYEKSHLGLQWRGFITLKTSYEWYPRQLSPNSKLLGIESTLWTETVVSSDDMDYLIYPRLMANAEVGWTGDEGRSFDEFMLRLPAQFARLDMLGVKYSKDYE
jgi:N-acetyl-beta-hexosaminidase